MNAANSEFAQLLLAASKHVSSEPENDEYSGVCAWISLYQKGRLAWCTALYTCMVADCFLSLHRKIEYVPT